MLQCNTVMYVDVTDQRTSVKKPIPEPVTRVISLIAHPTVPATPGTTWTHTSGIISGSPRITTDHLWKWHDLDVMADALPSLYNYCRNPDDMVERFFDVCWLHPLRTSGCRNPDDDRRGPWCFTDYITDQMEYCDIPRCGT